MAIATNLPACVRQLVTRLLTSGAARSPAQGRHDVFDYVDALTRGRAPVARVAAAAEPYLRKVALAAHTVLDRDLDALRETGSTTDEIFELTVVAAVSAGVTRMTIALAALEEARDAARS